MYYAQNIKHMFTIKIVPVKTQWLQQQSQEQKEKPGDEVSINLDPPK